MRSFTLLLISTSILVLPACGGDPMEATTGTDSTTGGSTGPVTNSTTNPTSASTTGVEDTTTAGTDNSDTAPTTNPTTGEPETTVASSTSESGTTTTDGTTGPVETTDGTTTDGTTTDGTTTDGTTTGGTSTGGTTGAPVCVGLPAMECMANEACIPLGGGKLNLQKMCVGKPMFLGCVDAGACGDALTYACDSAVNPPEPYLFPSTCLPDGWEPCEAPPIEMPCK